MLSLFPLNSAFQVVTFYSPFVFVEKVLLKKIVLIPAGSLNQNYKP